MNLRVLAPSRTRRKVGEIFVFCVREGEYYWGRVIALNVWIGMPRAILVYLYDARTPDDSSPPRLDTTRLLVPPLGTVNVLWSRGYFKTVMHVPLGSGDVLQQHSTYRRSDGLYMDEFGAELDRRHEPCGIYGLATPYGVDCDICRALGIPLVSNEGKGERW